MKTKEEIENLKDIRRNLWIIVIGIVGGLSVSLLSTSTIIFNWLFVLKIVLGTVGLLVALMLSNEIICCNKKIVNLINKLKEE